MTAPLNWELSNKNHNFSMKRKQRFVTPKVTRAVPLYPESDLLVPGSTMYDQEAISAGQLTNTMTEGTGSGNDVYQSYWE